ncbi:hypothetical protein EIP91_007362 [Steccherinum ochraceum]|uniref:Uncharacterized protein n=1 Tax=Steccherinum ochraceum TaxID=92696 RepID=A0A4R0RXC0_9APHY|nr:hypothetical protein EIP91_007362 [Steccherinum ochraceum]
MPTLPNPLTPMAWLPPDTAKQVEAAKLILAAIIGGWVWDVLMSLREEVKLFSRSIKLPGVVYMFARITTGCYVTAALLVNGMSSDLDESYVILILNIFFEVLELNDCQAMMTAIGVFACLSMSSNSLLFLFRIIAVFHDQRPIIYMFVFLWTATFGATMAAPFSLGGVHIGTTRYCTVERVKRFGTSGIVSSAVYDTLVFLAITVRLLMDTAAENWRQRLRILVGGRGMGHLSRALMQGDQQYYLATVCFGIVAAALILAPSVPITIGNLMAVPGVAVQNAMACRVFRHLKLGCITDTALTIAMGPSLHVQFNRPPSEDGTTSSGDGVSFASRQQVENLKGDVSERV